MSNIKPNYLIPGLGMAVIWNDFSSALNTREEWALLIYHILIVVLIIVGGIVLWFTSA